MDKDYNDFVERMGSFDDELVTDPVAQNDTTLLGQEFVEEFMTKQKKSNEDYLAHYGIKGMKWGVRRDKKYSSTGVRSAIARRQNEKVDKGFKNWKENSEKKNNAIQLGKKANLSKIAYENNKSDKSLKSAYKQDNKEYKKALKSNTTYRKGAIKNEVGKDLSRKYLSEAKKVKKQIDKDPTNKQLQKQYDSFMSKHDVERAKARRAPEVAANRSRKKAAIKRTMTMTVKTAATTAAVSAGAYYTNKYLANHQYTLNGNPIRINKEDLDKLNRAVRFGKEALKYV